MGNLDTIDDVKAAIEVGKKELATLRRHFDRLEELYGDCEDKAVALEKKLNDIEDDILGDDTKLLEQIATLEVKNEQLTKDIKKLGKVKSEPSIAAMFDD